MAETTHLGRKISRLRELRGMKQETLAEQLGISQQSVSKIEQSEQVEDVTLERIAKALGLTVNAVKNFNEEALFNLIQNNTFHDHSTASTTNYQCTINPIEKIEQLYDALIKCEREKIALLEKLMEKMNEKK